MTTEWVATVGKQYRKRTLTNHPIISALLLLTYFVNVLATSDQDTLSRVIPTGQHNTNSEPEEHVPSSGAADKRAPWSSMESYGPMDPAYTYSYLPVSADRVMESLRPSKRGMDDGQMPGVLRFGKRAQSFIRFGRSMGGDMMMDDGARMLSKKEMPGVLRFGKRRVEGQQEKKAVPGVLRFGKRDDIPGVLRFGKRDDIPGVLRFGKRDGGDMPGVLRFGKRYSQDNNYLPAGVLRFGKRDGDMPGVLRFGKKSDMPGVLRFGKRSDGDMPGVLRFGKRSSDMPGVLRFG